MVKVEKLPENIRPATSTQTVRLKITGNILEVRSMSREQTTPILKIDREHYISLNEQTGELKTFQHKQSRAQALPGVSQSLRSLRDLINANATEPEKCRWVTLTYGENMTDTERLYHDFRKFNQRFRYYLSRNHLPGYEYIVAMEPQGRGAWHAHAVLIFSAKAPYIPARELERIWRQGFARIKSLDTPDNVGLYLTAYLTDLEVTEAVANGITSAKAVKEVEIPGEDGKPQRKAVVKGGRLHLYPSGFRLYRKSRGILPPLVLECTEKEAMEMVGDAPLVFEKTIRISDGVKTINTINYRQYNQARARCDGEA